MTDTIMQAFAYVGILLSVAAVASFMYAKYEEWKAIRGLSKSKPQSPNPGADAATRVMNKMDEFRNLISEVRLVEDGKNPLKSISWAGVEGVSVRVDGEPVTRYLKLGPTAYRYIGTCGYEALTHLLASGAMDDNPELVLHLATVQAIDEQLADPDQPVELSTANPAPTTVNRKTDNLEALAQEYDLKERDRIVKDSDVDKLVSGVEDSIKGDVPE